MTSSRSLLPSLSDAITHDVRVEVLSQYSSEHSHPLDGEWVFQYTVRITNQGNETVQLISRHWIITDAAEQQREVKGDGVVGQQPILAPGESFKYSSWCPLETSVGSMQGTYQMASAEGERFEIEIAPFGLNARHTVN
jgi:ApaG protein